MIEWILIAVVWTLQRHLLCKRGSCSVFDMILVVFFPKRRCRTLMFGRDLYCFFNWSLKLLQIIGFLHFHLSFIIMKFLNIHRLFWNFWMIAMCQMSGWLFCLAFFRCHLEQGWHWAPPLVNGSDYSCMNLTLFLFDRPFGCPFLSWWEGLV